MSEELDFDFDTTETPAEPQGIVLTQEQYDAIQAQLGELNEVKTVNQNLMRKFDGLAQVIAPENKKQPTLQTQEDWLNLIEQKTQQAAQQAVAPLLTLSVDQMVSKHAADLPAEVMDDVKLKASVLFNQAKDQGKPLTDDQAIKQAADHYRNLLGQTTGGQKTTALKHQALKMGTSIAPQNTNLPDPSKLSDSDWAKHRDRFKTW